MTNASQVPQVLPEWLLDIYPKRTAHGSNGHKPAGEVGDTIPEGERNATLLSLAGSMRRRGMGEAAIVAALLEENLKCVPGPLGESEVRDIARSVMRYDPAPRPIEEPTENSGEPPAPPRLLRFQSAAEIARETPEQPDWIVSRYVPAGSIVEVTGKIKAAGKTTLVLAMCRKVLDGLDFLGEPTVKTPIVYLTEQPLSSFREALRRADLLERHDFYVLRYQETIGVPWPQVAAAAARECQRVEAKLLAVDTLPQFARLRGNAENDSGAALEALEPIQAVAGLGIGVIVCRHDGKADREVGDSGRGSSAWGGVADIIISIRRGEGNSRPTIRVLHSLSRFDETPDKLVVDLNTTTWEYTAEGTGNQVALRQAKEAILKIAPESEEEALKTNDLIDRAEGVKPTIGKEGITELVAAGDLVSIGTGHRNAAKRFWKPQMIQSEPPVVATELNAEPNGRQDTEQPQLIRSLIGNVVPTESIISRPQADDREEEPQPGDLEERPPIDSVATPTLYTTESIKDDVEVV